MQIGIECGGTFTDVVVVDDKGQLAAINKLFSTPSSPAEAVIAGLRGLGEELTRDATPSCTGQPLLPMP